MFECSEIILPPCILRWTKMNDTQIEDILKKGDKDKDGYLTNLQFLLVVLQFVLFAFVLFVFAFEFFSPYFQDAQFF